MELSRNRYGRCVGLILAAALAVRIVAAFWWQNRLGDHQFAFADSESYWVMSRAIAAGEPFQYGSSESRMFRMPGYPLVLVPLFWIGGASAPVIWARMLGAILGTTAVAAVAELARKLFGDGPALIAAAWAAFYPGAVGMSVFVLSEAPFCPLMVLHLLLWGLAWRLMNQASNDAESDRASRSAAFRSSAVYSVISGFVAGLATLMKPSWLLFIPFTVLSFAIFSPRRIMHLKIGAVMIAGFVIAMSPWWIRNYRITGKFVPSTLQVGATLYDSLRPGATGASDANMQFVDRIVEEQRAAEGTATERLDGTFEYRLDRRMRDAAVAWATENPREVARLSIIKFWRTWSPLPNADEFQSGVMRFVVAAGYLPILILGIAGAVRFSRHGGPTVLCLMPTIYLACLHAVFIGSIRYRQPAMLVLIVLAAATVDALLTRFTRKEPACDS